MEIVTLGIDLAKNIFALHGVDDAGKVVLQRPAVKRAKLLELTGSLPPCLIGMEACSGAHHWAREPYRALDAGCRGSSRLLEGGGGNGGEERAPGLSGAASRRRVHVVRPRRAGGAIAPVPARSRG